MTLIARARFGSVPIYFGDLLLSKEGDNARPVNIPAADDINALLSASRSRSVSGICQKLNMISDRLIVAWAGNFVHARAAIREIADLERAGELCRGNIRVVLDRIPLSEKNDISLVGSVCSPESGSDRVLIEHFNYRANKHTDTEQEIVISGSGEGAFMEILPQTISQEPPPIDEHKRFFWAENIGLVMAAELIGHEITIGSNLLDWWGGGIEVATYENGKFVKHGNVLHTFWHQNLSKSNDGIHLDPKFIKYDYFHDALVIQKFECDFTGEGKVSVTAHDYRVYTPLLKSRHDYEFASFPWYDLGYQTLHCYVIVDGDQTGPWSFVKTFRGSCPFEVALEDEGLRISFEDKFIRELIGETKQPPS